MLISLQSTFTAKSQ